VQRIKKYLQELRYRPVGLVLLLILALSLVGCGGTSDKNADTSKPTIAFANPTWDSIQVHNRIAGFIVEHGYGYPVDYVTAGAVPSIQGLGAGNTQIDMEMWIANYGALRDELVNEGKIKDLGANFADSPQGWYVPTYMIKGNPERGIEPVAPDLKSISDLPKYWELFKDPEAPNKGRFHNGDPGWTSTVRNEKKLKAYGLDKYFNNFITGSDTALATSMVTAYEKGEPWFGYYWEPTWVMGKLDMTLLEEPPYNEEVWNDTGACAYTKADVNICVNSELENYAPEVVEFLKKYQTTLEQNNKFLAYMQDHGSDVDAAAFWFLEQYPDVWKTWVPEDIAANVEAALEEVK